MDRATKRKVTAGLPALHPEARHSIDLANAGRDRNDALVEDKIQKDKATVAPDGAVPTTSQEAQLARVLATSEVKARLLHCNPNFHFEVSRSDPDKTGIYILENKDGASSKRFICGMETHYQPEFSIREDTVQRVPDPRNPGEWLNVPVITVEKFRGWRTVLARLLRERLITESQIEQYFKVSQGRSSANWQLFTR